MSVEKEDDIKQMDSTFEAIVEKEIGGFGLFQIVNITLIFIIIVLSGFLSSDYIFTAARLNHRCLIPECDLEVPQFESTWIYDAIPKTSGGLENCKRYTNKSSSLEEIAFENCPVLFDNNTTVTCESYVYEDTNSIVYDFNLECKEWLRALVGVLTNVGAMISLMFAGYISDYYGRRVAIVFFTFNIALIGVIRSFSVNFAMFLSLQILQSVFGGGLYSAGYILATEIVGTKFRVFTGAIISTAFAIGLMFLGLFASQISNWRILGVVLYTPAFIGILYYWLLTESFRWLITKRKDQKTRAVLYKAAGMNGKTLSEKSVVILINSLPVESQNTSEKQNIHLWIRVYQSKVMLKRCFITPVWWMASTFIYYGLSINSVSLSGNMYTNFIVTAAIEIPGYWTSVLLLDWFGRKNTMFWGYLLCSFCCAAFILIPDQYPIIALCLYLIGKFGIALVFAAVYIYTFELYPTRHRHSFLGFCSMMGRVGSILAPLTPPLMLYWYGLPSALFSILAGISAVLVLTQPETLGTGLPDTFEEAENIGK